MGRPQRPRHIGPASNIPPDPTPDEEQADVVARNRQSRELFLTEQAEARGFARVDDFLRMMACRAELTLDAHEVSADTARVFLPVTAWACVAVDAHGVHVHLGPVADAAAGQPSEEVLAAIEREVSRYRRKHALVAARRDQEREARRAREAG